LEIPIPLPNCLFYNQWYYKSIICIFVLSCLNYGFNTRLLKEMTIIKAKNQWTIFQFLFNSLYNYIYYIIITKLIINTFLILIFIHIKRDVILAITYTVIPIMKNQFIFIFIEPATCKRINFSWIFSSFVKMMDSFLSKNIRYIIDMNFPINTTS
jgi:hypothetical protein